MNPVDIWEVAVPHRLVLTMLHHRECYFCCKNGALGPIPAADGIQLPADIPQQGTKEMVKKVKGDNKTDAGIRRLWNPSEIWNSQQQFGKGHQLSCTWLVLTWICEIFMSLCQKHIPGPAPRV